MAYKYPYGNRDTINLDWFINEFQKLKAAWEEERAGIEGALDEEIARAEAALADVFAARDTATAAATAASQSADSARGYSETATAQANAATLAAQGATTARSDALAAQSAAEAAASNASGFASNASTSANAADTSAQSAAQSVINARTAQSAAAQSATLADSARQAAQTAQTEAETAATNAATSADDAETAATSIEESAQQITTNTNDISDLKESLNTFSGIDEYAFEYGNVYNGSINTDTNRIHSVKLIRVKQGMTILSQAGFANMAIPMYDIYGSYKANGTWVESFTVPYDGYIRPILRKTTGNANIEQNEFAELISTIKVCYPNVEITSDMIEKANMLESTMFSKPLNLEIIKGAIYATGYEGDTVNEAHTENGVLNPTLFEVKTGANAHIFLYNNETYIGKFASDGTINKTSGKWKVFNGLVNVAELIKGTGANVVRVSLLPTDGTTITAENAQTWGSSHLVIYGERDAGMSPSACIINAGMIKQPIKLNRLGAIGSHQSFAKYNGKYYVASSDGSFRVYDDTLTLETSTTIDLGHANSFQVGDSNKAYVSGWSNKTIYVLNLDTLIVDNTIVLPIDTGYFDAVVDEVNQYAYIVNTVEDDTDVAYYQFITYDIPGNQILNVKRIPRKMYAIQGMSYYEGKIYLSYGYTTHTIPNGYIVLNTNGDIIGEYVIPYLAEQEPEGFFVDGSVVLLSVDIGGLLYSIESPM